MSGSRLAFPSKPLVKRLDGVAKIRRDVSRTMIFQEIQLTNETEGRGIEIETLVHTRRLAQQDSTHEPLSPCKIISPQHGIGPDVVLELLARRRAQTDDPSFLR